MLALAVRVPARAAPGSARGMATLRDMKNRIRAVGNMAKITKSMKMVAAAKLKRAEKAMVPAIPMGNVSLRLQNLLGGPTEVKKRLIVCITADRGLCGAINTSVAKEVKKIVANDEANGVESRILLIGDKGRVALNRGYIPKFALAFNDFGKQNFSYGQAAFIADEITKLEKDFSYDVVTLVANHYQNIVSYNTTSTDIISLKQLEQLQTTYLSHYGRPSRLPDLWSHYLTNAIFRACREAATVEQAQRMSAMENASKNAKEMVAKLTLTYNRTRQAVITKELIEIISGAAAL
jgi:F-type H+-transporting ATPase subunit gamma